MFSMVISKIKHRALFILKNKGVFTVSVQSFKRDLSSISSELVAGDHPYSSSRSLESAKQIPVSVDDFKSLKRLKPCQPCNPCLLKVSILGEPNVGKSTLTNNLVKWKVCAVSRKVHTTRRKATAVFVEDNRQIVFLDTPGFVNPEQRKKHSLEPSFMMDPIASVRNADLVAVVVDISNKFTNNRIPGDILDVLEDFKDKQSILILNKIDAMKSKARILSLTKILTKGVVGGCEIPEIKENDSGGKFSVEDIANLTNKRVLESTNDMDTSDSVVSCDEENRRGWSSFSRVFMVSALKNDGMDDLRNYLLSEAPPHDWIYHDSIVTDQHPHEIALTTVREKLLEYLPEEIPYSLDLRVTKWELLSTGCPKIDIKIACLNARHRRFVIGPGGRHIAACADKARRAMREAFRKDVVLHLAVV